MQDDARQHVFWMQRFIDSELFPHDLIADYFQSVAPTGYTTLYRIAAALGSIPFWQIGGKVKYLIRECH